MELSITSHIFNDMFTRVVDFAIKLVILSFTLEGVLSSLSEGVEWRGLQV